MTNVAMPTIISCPHCAKKCGVPDNSSGTQLKCPHCNLQFFLQTSSHASPVPIPLAKFANQDAAVEVQKNLEPHRADSIMFLAILGVLVFPIVFSTIAVFMAMNDLQKMKAGHMDRAGEKLTKKALVIGKIGICFGALVIFWFVRYS
jgi:hypothetical protein